MEAVSTDRPLSEVKDTTPYDKFVQVITSLLDLKTKPPYPPDDNIWKTDLFDGKNEQKEQKQEPESEADHPAATIALQADRILDNYRDSSFARSVLELVESLDATQRLALYILMAWFVKHFTKSVCPKKFGGKREEALRSSLGALTEEGLIVSDYNSDEGCPTSSNQDYRVVPQLRDRCSSMYPMSRRSSGERRASSTRRSYPSSAPTPRPTASRRRRSSTPNATPLASNI